MKRCLLALCAAMLVLLSCSRVPGEAERPHTPADEASFQQGVLNVKFSAEMAELLSSLQSPATRSGSASLDEVLDAIGATSIRRLFPYDPVYEPRQHSFGLDRWYVVEYGDAPATRAAAGMAEIPGVEFSEAPRRRALNSADSWKLPFDDPEIQWALMNDGSAQGHVRGADINVVPVWDKFTTGSPDVIVGLVDGGVDITNPDLAPVVLTGMDQSFNFCNDTGELVPHDHGTHVAGIIGAVGNNGQHIRGVAGGSGNGGVRILNCQVFQYDPEYSSSKDWYDHTLSGSTAEAIVWACNHGALICNNSWGYTFKTEGEAIRANIDRADKEAIDYFVMYAGCDNSGNQLPGSLMKGGLVVFASGNESWQDYMPSAYEPVVSVAAITPGLMLAPYSNYGSTVDICAPGGDSGTVAEDHIISTLPMDSKYVRPIYSTACGYMSGTSMACPHVSGVAALLVSWFGGEGFTADQLRERLIGGADAVATADFEKAAGPLLDAFGAFKYPDFLTNRVETLTASAPGRTALLSCILPEDADGCIFAASRDASLLEGLDPLSIPMGVVAVSAWGAEGSEVSASLVLDGDSDYQVVAFARNHNHFAPASDAVLLHTGANRAPVAASLPDVLLDTIGVTQAVDVLPAFSDPDGDELTITAESSAPDKIAVEVQEGRLILTSAAFASATISVTATDVSGLSATTSFMAVCRDKTRSADIYPMPVTDVFNIAPGPLASVSWKLYSPEGRLVLEGSGQCSSFAPAQVDMTGFRPGIYLLTLDIMGEVSHHQVVKI